MTRATTRLRLVTNPRPLGFIRRGFALTYRVGEPMRCPGCGRRSWVVGRATAECANERCGFVVPIDQGGRADG